MLPALASKKALRLPLVITFYCDFVVLLFWFLLDDAAGWSEF